MQKICDEPSKNNRDAALNIESKPLDHVQLKKVN
jgi:hypothetical protein